MVVVLPHSEEHGNGGGTEEHTPTWQWIIPPVSTGSNHVSEQPNDLAPALTKIISKKLCHVNLHKAYFLGQA